MTQATASDAVHHFQVHHLLWHHFCHCNQEIVGLAEDPDSTNLKCKMFGGFSYDIQINTTNPEDMDNLDILLNFDWMNHVANQMEIEMAYQMERKYPKEQDRKVLIWIFLIWYEIFDVFVNSSKISVELVDIPKFRSVDSLK